MLVVGGSSEIGAALARAWLRTGTRYFAVTERSEGRAAELVADLESGGATVDAVVLDALRPESIAAGLEAAWKDGDVDVVVIAIGLLGVQRDVEADPSLSWDVLTVNATSTIQLALDAARRMEAQQHGTIVLLSSVAGQRGRRDNYVYGASKAAVDTFGEGLQQRFAGTEIDVMLVRPGYVVSKMSSGVDPAPFAVTVEQSCERIIRAIAQRKEVVWVPPVLASLFFLFRLLPRKAWGSIVVRMR